MQAPRSHQFSCRVYAEDTDMMGIVYHANYLRFFERARTEMIRESDLSLTTLAEYDCHFVISKVTLDYHYPAKLDDLLSVTSTITTKKRCSLAFYQNLFNQDGKLLCDASVEVACINAQMKPKRIPKNLFGGEDRG